MNYGSCSCCNKVIRYDKLRLCKDCEEMYLHKVKEFIYDNGIKTINEINQATGVPIRVIEYFINNNYFAQVNLVNDEEYHNSLSEAELERQLAILDALKNSFAKKEEVVEEESKYGKAEMRFLDKEHRR